VTTSKDKLLILDLDETLVFASEQPLARESAFRAGPYHVYKRPHVDTFLATCLDWFEVAVWTSSSPSYAAIVVKELFPQPQNLSFVWAADRCTRTHDTERFEHHWRKNLKKVRRKGYRLESVIVVDDSPEKWEQSYGNLVRVRPFLSDQNDEELLPLLVYLNWLRAAENVRGIEKRRWRSQTMP
jgi:RNA polymerase II subunit A small phosphatase-like protein